jgi:hypothetical protein
LTRHDAEHTQGDGQSPAQKRPRPAAAE